MDNRKKFWINFFMGGAAGALGAFGIGLMVGAAWMFFWPVNLRLTTATGMLLVVISGLGLTISTKFTKEFMRRPEQERENAEGPSETSAQ